VYFGNNGPFCQGQQAFFKVGIFAFNGNGLFGVVTPVLKHQPTADVQGYQVRVISAQPLLIGFNREPQPGQKFVS
jgi:hypothetical protein